MTAIITLADFILDAGGADVLPIIESAVRPVPELTGEQFVGNQRIQLEGVPHWESYPGISYETIQRVGIPTVPFRLFGEGPANTNNAYAKKKIESFPIGAKSYIDKQMADIHPKGHPYLLVRDMVGQMQGFFKQLGMCFYYGLAYDAKGFPGLRDVVDTTNMVIDKTGSTAGTGSTVWAVRFGPEDVSWQFGNDGKFELSEIDIRDKPNAGSSPPTCYHQELSALVGLQVADSTAVGCIKNVTAQVGKTLTDEDLGELVDRFPENKPPHVFFMSGRSRRQVTNSRTATSASGAKAPLATDHEGIPIIATGQISRTETLW